VDLWGTSVEARDQQYDGDALQVVFSSTKNIAAIAVATLADKGLLDYSDKVSRHWKEFACRGKEDVTLADLLRHEAGLPTFENSFPSVSSMWTENLKKNEVGAVIEGEACRFPPAESGSRREYHSLTRGFILNEIFRRVDPQRRTLAEFVEEEFSQRLDLDVHVGTRDDRQLMDRIALITIWPASYCLGVSALPAFISERSVLGFWDMLKRAYFYATHPSKFPWPTAQIGSPIFVTRK